MPLLPALQTHTHHSGQAFRPRAARPQDSSAGVNVLPGAPGQPVRGRVELLTNATELQVEMMDLVDGARTSIKADFCMLSGSFGQELARQLAGRARNGLRVQMIAWGPYTPAQLEAIKAARAMGIIVRLGHEDVGGAGHVGKFVLVDDRVALVGTSAGMPGPCRSRRGLLRLSGEAACELGRQFNHDWAHAGGQPLPLPAPSGLMGSFEVVSAIQIRGQGPKNKSARALVLTALNRARSRIEIIIDRIDDPAVVAAVIDAHQRGVQVRLLFGADETRDGWRAKWLGQDGQARALTRLQSAGVPVRQAFDRDIALRMAVVDRDALLFGSQAWTREGFASSGELMVEARGGREPGAVRAMFQRDWDDAVAPPPSGRRLRVAAAVAPLLREFSRLVARYSLRSALQKALGLHVGLVRFPGGRWQVVTQSRA